MRGDLNRRPVQWLRLWRATLTGGKPDLHCGQRRAFAVAFTLGSTLGSSHWGHHTLGSPISHPRHPLATPVNRYKQDPTTNAVFPSCQTCLPSH